MKKTIMLLTATAVIVLLISCQNRQGGRNNEEAKDIDKHAMIVEDAEVEGQGAGSQESGSAEEFVTDAASGSMMEIDLGKYAQQNASNQRVRNFGAMMVSDHTEASAELRKIVEGKNIQIPSSMQDKHQDMSEELKKKSGDEFDREYMKEMVDDHEKDVDLFRKQSENASDPEIRAFAGKILPVLEMHLDSAKAIRDAITK